MRRIILTAGLVAAVAAPAGGAVTAPALHVVTKNPLVVRGTSFHARERVTVTSGTARVVVLTTPAGAFRANLGAALGDRCSFRIVASGTRGDRVTMASRTECAPASTP